MKILIVTDKMEIGGAETHIFTLICELIKNGDSVTLLSAGGAYAQSLGKKGAEICISPLDKRDPVSVLRCKRDMAALMRRCDVVHTHTRFSSFLAKTVRGKKSFPPIVVTAHLNFKLFPFGKLAYWGDATLAVSEDIKEYLISNYGLTSESIGITRNSVDISKYNGDRIPKKLIIHTSRIDKGRSKTAFLLCDCAEKILTKYPDWRILTVGDGNCYAALKKRTAEVNKALGFEGIILCGARYDIPSILRYGSIFVGVSRSALEGMAAGLPTIISGDEGYGGILSFDNYDLLLKTNFCARNLKQATKELLISDIEYLINNEQQAKGLSEYSRKTVEEHFASDIMATDAKSCYNLTRSAPALCLLGYFGHGNLGDETILQSAIAVLEKVGIKRISILLKDKSKNAHLKAKVSDVDIDFYDRMNPIDLKRAIDGSDALVLCGGNLLQNETSLASLLYYSQIVRYAHTRGRRIYILSGGFGGLRGAYAKYIAARAISRSDFCGCRTEYDLDFAEQYTARAVLMPDLCFLLDRHPFSETKNSFCWVISGKGDIPLADITNIAIERKLKPLAITFNPEQDRAQCEKVRRLGIEVFAPTSYREFSHRIKNCAFVISERLHGAIFSTICHTPAYLSANSAKKTALISEFNRIVPNSTILTAYSKDAVLEKKEIGAQDSDFDYLIDYMRREIHRALSFFF